MNEKASDTVGASCDGALIIELMAEPPLPLGIFEGTSVTLRAEDVREFEFDASLVKLDALVTPLGIDNDPVRVIDGFGNLATKAAPKVDWLMTEATVLVVTALLAAFPVPVPILPVAEELTATGVRGREDSSDRGDMLLPEADEAAELNDSLTDVASETNPEAEDAEL